MTLEKDYQGDVAAICERHPAGSEERRLAKAERWEQYEVAVFKRDGKPRIVWALQGHFAKAILVQLSDLYGGKIDAAEYRRRKIDAARRYARRLFELGLMTEVFDDDWVRARVGEVIRTERELVPLKTTGFTKEDAALLCDRSISDAKDFFRSLHVRFGLDRLKRTPEIFGGIDESLRDAEEKAVVGLATGETVTNR